MTVIDGDTNTTTTLKVGAVPNAIVLNPTTHEVFVSNSVSKSVSVISP